MEREPRDPEALEMFYLKNGNIVETGTRNVSPEAAGLVGAARQVERVQTSGVAAAVRGGGSVTVKYIVM